MTGTRKTKDPTTHMKAPTAIGSFKALILKGRSITPQLE